MKRTLRLGMITFLVFAAVGVRSQARHKAQSSVESAPLAKPSDGGQYQPSDQVFTPFELSRNTYKYKGQSGILDTRTVYWGNDEYLGGQKWGTPPTGGLRLERMIDEHTAIYEILTLQRGVGPAPEGEIAVFLPDSNPPDPLRFWRVLVEGVLKGTNSMGATVQVPAVRFEGYAEEPAQKLDDDIQTRSHTPHAQPDAPEGGPARIPASAIAGNRIFFAEPQYPPTAKTAHMSGTVVLRATISKTGNVEKLQVVSFTSPVFIKSALDSVKQWRYKPYLISNEPTEVDTTITISFALNGGD